VLLLQPAAPSPHETRDVFIDSSLEGRDGWSGQR
jgi:hypothetical protein